MIREVHMDKREFKGRSILPGCVEGESVVTKFGFNTLACFSEALVSDASCAICSDHNNPDLFGKQLDGKIICIPKTIGSTTAGAIWEHLLLCGLAPKAMLFADRIDSLAAAGLVVADIWVEKRIVTIDKLGYNFLNHLRDNVRILIQENAKVIVG